MVDSWAWQPCAHTLTDAPLRTHLTSSASAGRGQPSPHGGAALGGLEDRGRQVGGVALPRPLLPTRTDHTCRRGVAPLARPKSRASASCTDIPAGAPSSSYGLSVTLSPGTASQAPGLYTGGHIGQSSPTQCLFCCFQSAKVQRLRRRFAAAETAAGAYCGGSFVKFKIRVPQHLPKVSVRVLKITRRNHPKRYREQALQ